jgi:hypothetical protein
MVLDSAMERYETGYKSDVLLGDFDRDFDTIITGKQYPMK